MSGLSPVSIGTTPISTNSADRDYAAKLKAAKAQADGNPNVFGIQELGADVGELVSDTRTKYGAVTTMPNVDGDSTFAQNESPGNIGFTDPRATTGNAANEVSATTVPQEDPSEFQTDALAKRMEMLKGTMPQGNISLNDRRETMRG